MRNHDDDEEPPGIPSGGPEPDTLEENTTLQRLQTLWIEANEEEQEQFVAWLALMKAQQGAGQPSNA